MRFAKTLPAMSLLVFTLLALAQDFPRGPGIDRPETLRNPDRLQSGSGRLGPNELAVRIRELGGELRDLTHDCGAARNTTYGQIEFLVRACSWGGRYPALLLEPLDPDDGPLVVVASNGSRLEVLFEDAAPESLVEELSGLLKEDFDEMFRDLSPTPAR